jgi:hypothetical protein
MKPYGIPRDYELECIDLGTITKFGLKTEFLHPPWNHACNAKDRARRYYKRVARQSAKLHIKKELSKLEREDIYTELLAQES